MKKRICCLIAFLVCVEWLNGEVSFLPDDPAVRELQSMYHRVGRVFPTATFPLGRHDLHHYAEELAVRTRNPDVLRELHYYLERLGYDEEAVRISVIGKASYKHTYRSRDEWEDYYRLFVDQPPNLGTDFICERDAWALFHAQAQWKKQYRGFTVDNFPRSTDGEPVSNENKILHRGYLRALLGPLELEVGRNAVHYGPGQHSSLLPSQRLPFIDALRYRVQLGPILMSAFVATLENRKAAEDVDPAPFDFESNVILCSLHRFEFHAPRMLVAISGLSFAVREQNAFQIGDISPVYSWHAADVGDHNLSVVLDLSVVPLAGLELFGQVGVDEVDARPVGLGDRDLPTIPAAIVGLGYTPPGRQGRLTGTLEAGWTHYLWGNFRVAMDRALLRVFMDGGNQILPATSPFGPGVHWLLAEGSWQPLASLRTTLALNYLSENTLANLTSTPNQASERVKDAPRNRTFGAGFDVVWSPMDRVVVEAGPVVYLRDGVTWVEISVGCSAGYGLSAKTSP